MANVVTNLSNANFEDLPFPGDATKTAGQASQIKEGRAEFWRGDESNMPAEAPYPFEVEEIIYVLEGAVDIEFENGEKYSLKAGDVGAFEAGTPATWKFTFPFTKLSIFPG